MNCFGDVAEPEMASHESMVNEVRAQRLYGGVGLVKVQGTGVPGKERRKLIRGFSDLIANFCSEPSLPILLTTWRSPSHQEANMTMYVAFDVNLLIGLTASQMGHHHWAKVLELPYHHPRSS